MPTTTKKTVAAKKKPAKKAAVKKTVSKSKKATTKALVYADNIHSFWVNDGQVLNSLAALHNALAVMSKDSYAYHVKKDKHDFAVWVEAVLCDKDCAADLRKAKTTTSAKTAVAKHLKKYTK